MVWPRHMRGRTYLYRRLKMSSKKKIRKLTDAQYNAYIAALQYNAASYNADGSRAVPDEIKPEGERKSQSD